jgi:hypothetical protein
MKAKQGQSFLDLVLQGTGNIENSFAMSVLNGVSITDNLFIDEEIIPAGKENKFITELWSEYNLPATAVTLDQSDELIEKLGIGTMVIKSTFIIG